MIPFRIKINRMNLESNPDQIYYRIHDSGFNEDLQDAAVCLQRMGESDDADDSSDDGGGAERVGKHGCR